MATRLFGVGKASWASMSTRSQALALKAGVLEKDVRQTVEGKAPAEPEKKPAKVKKYDFYGYVDRILLRVRRSIAKAMVKSKYTAPHVTTMDEADVTELWALRSKEKATAEKRGIKLTILPFIIKAVIAGLVEHPYLNATLDDENEEVILKKYYNIGVAVDTPEGLMVPVVKNAKDKSIFQLAELTQLSEKAKTGPLTWLISKGVLHHQQLWGCRGLQGTPIINHPEVAILGVGKIKDCRS
jgi:pyruvate dehydrogenase E2 component (dihydrolipoamide acetyltransferase)